MALQLSKATFGFVSHGVSESMTCYISSQNISIRGFFSLYFRFDEKGILEIKFVVHKISVVLL